MGKRKKASKPVGPKKSGTLPTQFQCLFCNHEKSVGVKIDKKAGVGTLSCKVCGQNFQSMVNNLSEAVDVYYEWVDACDAVAKGQSNPYDDGAEAAPAYAGTANLAKRRGGPTQDQYEDDFVVNDEEDGAANYRDED